jgi:copper transport protein
VVSLDPAPGSVVSAAPVAVRITFSEPVTPFGRGIDVYAPSGKRVSGTAEFRDGALLGGLGDYQPLEQGTYRVEWRVVARDTHPSRGTYTFSVGHASEAPAGGPLSDELGAAAPLGLFLQALARWLHFLGFALAFGGIAFRVLVMPDAEAPSRQRRLWYAGLALLVAAEPLALAGQAASLGGVDPQSLADVLASAFGRVLALRLGVAFLLWGALGALPQARGRGAWSLLGLGAGLAIVDGLAGHTIRGFPDLLAYLLTAVHEGAMALWVGGFVSLLLVEDRRPLLPRFGRLAAASVALLILSGALLALVHLRSPADLAFTAYGLTLAIKLLAVAAALGGAWIGLRSARSGWPEAAALASVLALAGLLASLPPPR